MLKQQEESLVAGKMILRVRSLGSPSNSLGVDLMWLWTNTRSSQTQDELLDAVIITQNTGSLAEWVKSCLSESSFCTAVGRMSDVVTWVCRKLYGYISRHDKSTFQECHYHVADTKRYTTDTIAITLAILTKSPLPVRKEKVRGVLNSQQKQRPTKN
ncbi:hypothetical protein ACROYT_G024168 [Oculina patagonica]